MGMEKMRVVNVTRLVSLFVVLQGVFGISNKEEKLLDEEFRRGAEDQRTSQHHDQLKTDTFQQNTYRHLGTYGHGDDGLPRTGYSVHEGNSMLYGQTPVIPFSYGQYGHNPDVANVHGYIPDVTHSHGYVPDVSHAYGYSSDVAQIYGNNINDLAYNYKHGSDLAHGYGHQHVDHDHEGGGYGITGIGNYLKKKLTLKKIFLPLAGIALIAALTSTNPVLLQLGTISAAKSARARVKRSESQRKAYPKNPFIKPKYIIGDNKN